MQGSLAGRAFANHSSSSSRVSGSASISARILASSFIDERIGSDSGFRMMSSLLLPASTGRRASVARGSTVNDGAIYRGDGTRSAGEGRRDVFGTLAVEVVGKVAAPPAANTALRDAQDAGIPDRRIGPLPLPRSPASSTPYRGGNGPWESPARRVAGPGRVIHAIRLSASISANVTPARYRSPPPAKAI